MTEKKGLSFIANQESIQMEKTLDMKEELIVEPQTNASITLPVNGLGDATAEDVMAGKTFTSKAGVKVTGTLASLPGELPEEFEAHMADKNNPHQVTASQAGAIPTTEKGAANGVATLDENGKVPQSQLPEMSGDYIKSNGKTVIQGTTTIDTTAGDNTKLYIHNSMDAVGMDLTMGYLKCYYNTNQDGSPAGNTYAEYAAEAINGVVPSGSTFRITSSNAMSLEATGMLWLKGMAINANAKRLMNLATPVVDSDAANKGYVDSVLANTGSGSGKKYATVVIGTSTAGHTAADCDYLCDGTDDEVEINAASNLLTNGGKILLLEGEYNISDRIFVNYSNTMLCGQGNRTILNINITSNPGISVRNASNCILKDFAINVTQASAAIAGNNNSDYVTIENIYINGNNSVQTGILLNSQNSTVRNCIIQNFINIGINTQANFSKLENNRILNCGNNSNSSYAGISVASHSIISNNYIQNCSNGIDIKDDEVLITGNIIRDCNYNGINATTNPNVFTSASIVGNIINNNGLEGISLGVNNINISNNTISYNGGTAIHINGENSSSHAKNNLINGNLIINDWTTNKNADSIYIGSYATDNLVIGNIMIGKNLTDKGSSTTKVNNKYT